MEATPRIELGMEVLQTSALPLGYVAPPGVDSKVRLRNHLAAQDFRDVMARHGDARKPLLLTELSWPSAKGKTRTRYGFEVSERDQASNESMSRQYWSPSPQRWPPRRNRWSCLLAARWQWCSWNWWRLELY